MPNNNKPPKPKTQAEKDYEAYLNSDDNGSMTKKYHQATKPGKIKENKSLPKPTGISWILGRGSSMKNINPKK